MDDMKRLLVHRTRTIHGARSSERRACRQKPVFSRTKIICRGCFSGCHQQATDFLQASVSMEICASKSADFPGIVVVGELHSARHVFPVYCFRALTVKKRTVGYDFDWREDLAAWLPYDRDSEIMGLIGSQSPHILLPIRFRCVYECCL